MFSPEIPHNETWLRGSTAAPPRRNVKPKDITAAGTGITPGKAFAQHPSITKITPSATRFDLLLLKNRMCARVAARHTAERASTRRLHAAAAQLRRAPPPTRPSPPALAPAATNRQQPLPIRTGTSNAARGDGSRPAAAGSGRQGLGSGHPGSHRGHPSAEAPARQKRRRRERDPWAAAFLPTMADQDLPAVARKRGPPHRMAMVAAAPTISPVVDLTSVGRSTTREREIQPRRGRIWALEPRGWRPPRDERSTAVESGGRRGRWEKDGRDPAAAVLAPARASGEVLRRWRGAGTGRWGS